MDETIELAIFVLAMVLLAMSAVTVWQYERLRKGWRLKATDRNLLRNAVRYAVDTGATWVRRLNDRGRV